MFSSKIIVSLKFKFQILLFIFMSLAFTAAFLLFYFFQTNNAIDHTLMLMRNKIIEAEGQIKDIFENRRQVIELRGANTIAKARTLVKILELNPELAKDPVWLASMRERLKIDHIRVFDKDLFIEATWPPVINFEPKKFLISKDDYRLGFSEDNPNTFKKSCAIFHSVTKDHLYQTDLQMCIVPFQKKEGGVAVGYKAEYAERWNEKLASMRFVSKGFRIGENGCFLIADDKGKIISTENIDLMNESLKKLLGDKNWNRIETELLKAQNTYEHDGASVFFKNNMHITVKKEVKGQMKLCNFIVFPLERHDGDDSYIEINGKPVDNKGNKYVIWYIIGESQPLSEILSGRNNDLICLTIICMLTFAVIFFVFSFFIKDQIVTGVDRINQSLKKITEGDLTEKASVWSCLEFAKLSDGINQTVDSLRKEMKNRMSKMDQDLKIARVIQLSAMQSDFPLARDQKKYNIYAKMKFAHEVGGDYYDYVLVSEDLIGFAIADISGKGIPAAMLMTQLNVYLRSLAESNTTISDGIFLANNFLCDNSESGMYVTLFLSSVQLSNGMMTFANAAHPMPVILPAAGGPAQLIDAQKKNDLMLGLIKDFQYSVYQIPLEKGDRVVLYTNGITDAEDVYHERYTQKRLLDLLNRCGHQEKDIRKVVDLIIDDVTAFAGTREQMDDGPL